MPKKRKKNTKKQIKTDAHFYYRSPVDTIETGVKSLFAKEVNLTTLLKEIRRDELAYRALKRLSGDIFDKWCNIKASFTSSGQPNLSLQQEVDKLNSRLFVKETFKQAWELKATSGFSLIGLGWKDSGKSIESDPDNITDIEYIYPLSRFNITENNGLVIDYRRSSQTKQTSVTYGKVVGAKIKFQYNVGDVTLGTTTVEERLIPATRFLLWTNFAPGSQDPYGMSIFEPVFDMLTAKKNLDWAFAEAAFQFAARKYVIVVPSNATPEYWKYIQDNWKDFDSLTTFAVKGEGHSFETFGGEGQLNPEPYFGYYITMMASGLGVPKPILFHELESGAEWALKDYYASISAIQRNDVEPMLLDLYHRLQEAGILSRGTINIEWNELMELDERESSFVTSRLALGHRMQAEAINQYLMAGLAVELTDDGWIKRIFVPDDSEENGGPFIILPSNKEEKEETQIPKLPEAEEEPEENIQKEIIKEMTQELLYGEKEKEKSKEKK